MHSRSNKRYSSKPLFTDTAIQQPDQPAQTEVTLPKDLSIETRRAHKILIHTKKRNFHEEVHLTRRRPCIGAPGSESDPTSFRPWIRPRIRPHSVTLADSSTHLHAAPAYGRLSLLITDN